MRRMFVAVVLWAVVAVGPGQVEARQDDPRIDGLFDRLHSIDDGNEAKLLMTMIWRLWAESGSPTVDMLFSRGIEAMNAENFDTALKMFNSVVEMDPKFAEGWNARATLHYLMGNYIESIQDIDKTLALEPRHWGALSGLGMIYQNMERSRDALQAYRRALAANPHLPGARLSIETLEKKIKGSPL
jgi:tetratricopeptide (TPR) repeat protein